MKNKLWLVAVLIITILMPLSVHAADNDILKFNVSAAATVAATGFRTQIVANSTIDMVPLPENEGGGNAIKIERTISGTGDNVVWNNGWADKSGNQVAIKTRIKTDEVNNPTTTKQIRTNGPNIYMLQIKGNELYSCGNLVSDFTVEAGKWYDIIFAVRKIGNSNYLDLYIDGVKVVTNSTDASAFVATTQLRFEINNIGTLYVGDTKIYKPEIPTFRIDNPALASATESVYLTFVKPMDKDTLLPSNFSIVGLVGPAPEFIIEPVTDDGSTSKIKLTFDSPLTNDNIYTITISNALTDIIGQPINANTAQFTTPPPEHIYSFGNGAQLYKGIGEDKMPIQNLEQGPITVAIQVTNNGMAKRQITLVSALYKGDKLIEFDYTPYELNGLETAEITTEINISALSTDLKLQVMVWKDITNPCPLIDLVEKK